MAMYEAPLCPRALSLICVILLSGRIHAQVSPVSLLVRNEGQNPFQLFWVDPDTSQEEPLSYDGGVAPGSDFSFESWPGHEFRVVELPLLSGDSRRSEDGSCRQARFRTQEDSQQTIRITPEFEAVLDDDESSGTEVTAVELVNRCRQLARNRLANRIASDAGSLNSTSPLVIHQELVDLRSCIEDPLVRLVERMQSEQSDQARVRIDTAIELENRTCLDAALDSSSDDVYNESWVNQGRVHLVHVKLNRPAARIHVVEDFISEKECRAIENATLSRLAGAIIADGKGGVTKLSARKSLQAIIPVDWAREADGDLTATLLRRVYNYTNHVLGLNIDERGQEPPAVIQYDGRGRDDPDPDHYSPHCDGDCNGRPFRHGERVSTTLMYCSVPDDGGHTNFGNAAVNVKPKLGSALFFSYFDPIAKLMDTGFTQHSGCPVFAGTKRVVLQVIRNGVDDETPWNTWNSLGVRHSDGLDVE